MLAVRAVQAVHVRTPSAAVLQMSGPFRHTPFGLTHAYRHHSLGTIAAAGNCLLLLLLLLLLQGQECAELPSAAAAALFQDEAAPACK
jgi:hypothetical protein